MDLKSLRAYEIAFELAMTIFEISKKFQKRKHIVEPTRYEEVSGRFVLIWRKPTGKGISPF